MLMPESISTTRAESVFSQLRQRIVEGDIATGTKLSEPSLRDTTKLVAARYEMLLPG